MLKIQKASAGSGKTFSLTREYITLLLGENRPDGSAKLFGEGDYGFGKQKAHGRILAITFTNKATQEMTSRIIKELSLLANPTPDKKSDHLKHLQEYYNTTADKIAEAARRALADLLFNFSWFNVSTIDSFFQNVLHTFARELDLPNTFNLEIDDNYPVAVAIAEMLSSINLPTHSSDAATAERLRRLSSWLESYMRSLIDNGRNANLLSRSSKINRELTATIARLRGETFKTNSKVILEYLSNPQRIRDFHGALEKSLEIQRKNITDSTLQLKQIVDFDLFPAALRNNYLLPWIGEGKANGKPDFSYSIYDGNGTLRKTLPDAAEENGKRHNALKKGQTWPDELDNAVVRLLRLGVTYFNNERFYKILRRQIYLLGLFSEACTHIDDYCRENEAFLLGDTNSLLRKVICEVECPFVYERIGYTINNYLIDEFQDTSEMQWENLRPLVMESLSRKKENLIIGDEKQCIYRFRNSNPELLGSKVESYISDRYGADGESMVRVTGVDIRDNTNWRSSVEVVTFNNSLFTFLARLVDSEKDDDGETKLGGEATRTYSALIQQIPEDHCNRKGYVKVIFGPIPKPEDKNAEKNKAEVNAPAEVVADSRGEENVTPKKPLRWTSDDHLRHLGQEIDRQLTAGYRPKEIAVLVRTHREGQMVIDHLLQLMQGGKENNWHHGHIDIISSDAMEISSSPAVQLIIGILRLATTPQYIADTEKPMVNGEPQQKLNPEYLRNRLIHRYELCVFDEIEQRDEDGTPVMDENGMPLMRRLMPEEALEKAIRATTPQPGEPNPDELQVKLDRETAKAGEMDCPSIFAITERIILNYVPEKSREEDCTFISAFQDLVLDFEERGESDIETFLKWWDSRGKFATLPAPEGQDAINVMTVHQSKGLEFECVHLPFCNQQLVKYKGEGWYKLNPADFPGVAPDCIPPFIPLTHSSSYAKIDALKAQNHEYEITQKIDGLNVAYVAFTRAVSELIVYSDPVTSRGEHFGSYLWKAVHKFDADKLAQYNLSEEQKKWVNPVARFYCPPSDEDGESMLVYGEPTTPRQDDSSAKKKAKPATAEGGNDSLGSTEPETSLPTAVELGFPESFDAEIPYADILKNYRIEQPADMVLPEDLEQMEFDIHNERHLGNFLHGALSHVRHLADLPLAMERAAYRCDLRSWEWEPFLKKLTNALNDPQIRPWFEEYESLMTERPLTAPEGLRRPDRVVVMPSGEVVVIDYKFGKPEKKYRDQVRNYMGLLSQAGYTRLSGYLYFPLTSQLVSVD